MLDTVLYTPVRMSARHCLYMAKRLKTAQINIRISPKLKAAAEKAAAGDQRSLTSLVEKLLIDHCRTGGYLKDEPKR
jgi:hypothetical protein